jgi:post-segregation antitoxin (ccd killing protein)
MEIRVHVPDELAAQAQARGLRPEAYAEEILARQVEMRSAEAGPPRSQEEIRAWLDSLAQYSDRIPPLPESISREWIYQDHD